jgi:hypothetical protein
MSEVFFDITLVAFSIIFLCIVIFGTIEIKKAVKNKKP